eukprot:gene4201-5258_t
MTTTVVSARDTITSDSNCPYQRLPTHLDDINYLGFNQEFHLLNTYYHDFLNFSRNIYFTVKQSSSFRIYIAPHLIDIDIWLYKVGSTQAIVHTTDATVGVDESIFATIEPGDYYIKLLFFNYRAAANMECPTISLEMAIAPNDKVKARTSDYKCPDQVTYPKPDFTKAESGSYKYDSDVDEKGTVMNLVSKKADTGLNNITFLYSYDFELKKDVITTDKWGLEFVLGSDFLSGGSLGLLLQSKDLPKPTDLKCIKTGKCVIGSHLVKSHVVLRQVVKPGNYSLWIYDQTQEKDYSIQPTGDCTPFSFSVNIESAHQTETFLNCPAYDLPVSFNEPGYMDDLGYLYFDDDVTLDLMQDEQIVNFETAKPSVLRVYIPNHRIDIDLQLKNDKDEVIAASYRWGGEEEMVVDLKEKGHYKLVFKYYSNNIDQFCETFPLEVAISPKSDYTDLNYCKDVDKSTAPDTTGMQDKLDKDQPYTFNLNAKGLSTSPIYNYMYNKTNLEAQPITDFEFTVISVYLFKAQVESNFLWGDVRLSLVNVPEDTKTKPKPISGDHSRNLHTLYVSLNPGKYRLSLEAASGFKDASVLPPCFPYSFTLQMQKQTIENQCWDSQLFPSNLNTPGLLSTSEKIHIEGEFLVPKIGILYEKIETTFTVLSKSFFRAYAKPTSIDVDLSLDEDNKRVTWSNSFDDEEPIEWILQPGKKYKLTSTFYDWSVFGDKKECNTYDMELAIVPMDEKPTDTCENSLPDVNMIPTPTLSPQHDKGNYKFTQNSTAFTRDLPFKVTGNLPAMFRAILTYDFVWNSLSFKLKTLSGQEIVSADMGYNRIGIPPTLLVPGSYILTIYEPFELQVGQTKLKNCVDFTFEFAIQSYDDKQVAQDTIQCPNILFPNSISSFGYLSSLSSNTLYFQETVLADVQKGNDIVTFELTKPSLVRVYIPVHATLDVDVVLMNGKGGVIDQSRTYGEEIIYRPLGKDKYSLKFSFYGLNHQPIPQAEDCTAFPVFISIVPSDDLLAIDSLTEQCSMDGKLPTTITGNTRFSQVFQRDLTIKNLPTKMTFTTTQAGHIFSYLGYNDVAASLAMKLNGTILVNGVNTVVTYNSLYTGGQASLSEVIPAGNWTLSVYDPYPSPCPLTGLSCSTFSFSYFLNTSTPDVPNTCEDLLRLPTDLTDPNTAPFGGPQNRNGEIRFSFDNFFIDPQSPRNFISFKVTKSSYMRLLSQSDKGNDLDFFIYSNASDPDSVIYYSTGGTNTEGSLWRIEPQANPYSLEVKFFVINKKQPCNRFRLDLAIKNADNVAKSLLCPSILPNEVDQVPPETIEFPHGKDVNIGSEKYLFTKRRIDENINKDTNIFRYRISLEAQAPTLLFAQIGFDFLANDFNLYLYSRRDNGQVVKIYDGVDQIPTSTDPKFNFLNVVTKNLTAGNYFLDITQNVKVNDFGIPNTCHYFSFQLTGQSQGEGTAPRMVSVTPNGAVDLNPGLPLDLSILFSEPVAYKVKDVPLINYINNNNAVLLENLDKIGYRIQPVAAEIKSNPRYVRVTFSGDMEFGDRYKLIVDTSKFKTIDDTMFGPEEKERPHIYSMFKCDCNGHGKCLNSTTNGFRCECDDPWAGTFCEKCKSGYHGAGTTCVANTKCQDDSCNGHGKCNDDEGYPECQCSTGYQTVDNDNMCATCDFGYTGYPNCVTNEDADRGNTCNAPILPSSLDIFPYLVMTKSVHIQDDFYVDLLAGSKDVTFTLTEKSLVRIFTEAHTADVDIWLYSLNMDGSNKDLIDKSLTFGFEEVVLSILEAGPYKISFKYYDFQKIVQDCETVNIEIAIDTIDTINQDTNNWKNKCSTDRFPDIPQGKNITDNWTYSSGNSLYSAQIKPSKQPVYLWNTTFYVSPPSDGLIAKVNAIISYQFLIGDLSLLIQEGNQTTVKCKGGDISAVTGCINGDNEMNRNVIRSTLSPGTYTLFIYAPEFPSNIMDCAFFNFDLSVEYIKDDEDYFNCDGDIFPRSFDNPEFLSQGYLHLQDTFLVDTNHTLIDFTLESISYVRIAIEQAQNAKISVDFINRESGDVLYGGPNIFSKVAVGKYSLRIISNFYSAGQKHFCPLINMEVGIEPVDAADKNLPKCPSDGKDDLPNFQAKVPFIFENGTNPKQVFSHFPKTDNNVAAIYSFSVAQTTQFYSAVSSEFLRGDLRVNLYKQNKASNTYPLYAAGVHSYNYNYIFKNLEAGSYQLKIERPDITKTGISPVQCIQFEFEFQLLKMAQVPECAGDKLPLSLNTIRYLGSGDRMHYESAGFLVPTKIQNSEKAGTYADQSIPFTVATESVFRIYTSPNSVDIDLYLYDISTGNRSIVAKAFNVYNEDSFVTILKPNNPYELQVQYWKWVNKIAPCTSYNMEIAISPLAPIIDNKKQCPGGKDFWPPDFPDKLPVNEMYTYSNLDIGAQLYFQQSMDGPVSHTMKFTTTVVTNFHSQVGYDFLTGDLSIRLTNVGTKKNYYGTIRPNRNFLDIVDLPAGSYQLVIHEPFTSIDKIMGCSYFNFEVYIEPKSSMEQEQDFFHYLPPTLNSYAYLDFNGQVHLQGEYLMYDGIVTHQQMAFSIKEDSLIRIQSAVLPEKDSNTYTETLTPKMSISGPSDFLGFGVTSGILKKGDYKLAFEQPLKGVLSNRAIDVELIIMPTDRVAKIIAAQAPYDPNSCVTQKPDDIKISPEGTYVANYKSLTIKSGTDPLSEFVKLPFTIEKPTLIYTQIAYPFLLLDLDLEIKSVGNGADTVMARGKINRNTNEINIVLQPGQYELSISSVTRLPANIFQDICVHYQLSISFSFVGDNHQDCTAFGIIPWDLNSQESVRYYGQSIDGDGYGFIYGDDFLLPKKPRSLVNMTLKESSLVSVFTKEQLTTTISTNLVDANSNSQQKVAYSYGIHNNNERSSVYLVDGFDETGPANPVAKEKKLSLGLSFSGSNIRGQCPSIEMQVIVKSLKEVTQDLSCPSQSAQYPKTTVKLDKYGAANEFLMSYFSGDFLTNRDYYTQNKGFVYYIDFEIEKLSRLEASFSFYSLASNFMLKIYTRSTNTKGDVTRSEIGSGEWNVDYTGGATTLTQSLSNAGLRPGKYSIAIVQPPMLNSIFGASIYGDTCFPFIYSLVILDSKSNYAANIFPSSGYYLPTEYLMIKMQFTSRLQDKNKNKITCDKNSAPISNIKLMGSSTADKLKPQGYSCIGDDPTQWSLRFEKLESNTQYSLILENGVLFDTNGVPIVLPNQHVYSTIDTSCSGHGQYSSSQCICSKGYSGFACDNCAAGFNNVNPHGEAVCVTGKCEPDTCGCQERINGECTVSYGQCSLDTSGNAVCSCSPQFNGTFCDSCAEGYNGAPYPKCTRKVDCGGCGKGECNSNSGQCQCPSNYVGDHCETCAPGYSGSDCKKNGSNAIIALEVIAGLVAGGLVIGLGIWYIRQRFRAGVARYKMLPRFEIDDNDFDDRGSKFPGLYESSDEDDQRQNKNNNFSINDSDSRKSQVFNFKDQPSNSLIESDEEF